MRFYQYEVGKPYGAEPNAPQSYPEGAHYNWRGAHTLEIFWESPDAVEVQSISARKGFAFLVYEDVIFFLFKLGGLNWSDAPYSIHLVERAVGPQDLPPLFDAPEDANKRQILNITLVDAATGIIRALNAVSFSPAFTRALHAAIREQALRPFPGDDAYRLQQEAAYRRYPTTDAMVRAAGNRCTGGEP